jgi:hypothetical protein
MPIVTQCTAPGCETLTIGPVCIEHEVKHDRIFVRGRPFESEDGARRFSIARAGVLRRAWAPAEGGRARPQPGSLRDRATAPDEALLGAK